MILNDREETEQLTGQLTVCEPHDSALFKVYCLNLPHSITADQSNTEIRYHDTSITSLSIDLSFFHLYIRHFPR